MGSIDLPFVILALAGLGLAIALSVLAGKVAAHLLYAASSRHKTDL